MSFFKFNIGDIIRNDVSTQRYVVVEHNNIGNVCVDALCARVGLRIVPFDFIKYYKSEDAYVIDDGTHFNHGPIVDDAYVDEYNLPNEYRWTEYKKSKNY